jgi:hypothetical protein
MHTTHLLTLLLTSLFALTSASPTTLPMSMQPRAEAAEKAVEVCGDFLLASTPMCCNEVADSESEDGLDCKEGKPLWYPDCRV